MKQVIQDLKKIFEEEGDIDVAAQSLSESQKRLSKQAARNVMLDIKDFVEGQIDETQLSLYLRQHGF